MLLPWFEPEITPPVPHAGVQRFDLDPEDGPANVRAIVEAQLIAMALHSAWMGVDVKTIHATGGASANSTILQVMADVFGADVYQFEVGNSACLGAALRAFHAHRAAHEEPLAWDEVVRGLAEPVKSSRVSPVASHQVTYGELIARYAECETAHVANITYERRESDR
jgi:xylulokinase